MLFCSDIKFESGEYILLTIPNIEYHENRSLCAQMFRKDTQREANADMAKLIFFLRRYFLVMLK
jgi:hypothetical protein